MCLSSLGWSHRLPLLRSFCVCSLYSHTGPRAQKDPALDLMLFYCNLEIPTIFNNGPHIFHFVLGPANYVAGPVYIICLQHNDTRQWQPILSGNEPHFQLGGPTVLNQREIKQKRTFSLYFYEIQFYVSSWVIT